MKKLSLKKDEMSAKKKGFTLVELLVATFIFLVIMTAVVAVFARQSVNFKYLQLQQRNVENAQFAINFIAKTLRTSTFPSVIDYPTLQSAKRIYLYDNSQKKCIRFFFDDSAAQLEVTTVDRSPSDVESCAKNGHYASGETYSLTTGYVLGSFDIVSTERDPDDNPSNGNQFRMGLATIRMEIQDQNRTIRPVTIQTSASLRDYPVEFRF